MKQKYPIALLILAVTLFSCKSSKAENLEEMVDITDHADPHPPVKLTEYFLDFSVSFS